MKHTGGLGVDVEGSVDYVLYHSSWLVGHAGPTFLYYWTREIDEMRREQTYFFPFFIVYETHKQ